MLRSHPNSLSPRSGAAIVLQVRRLRGHRAPRGECWWNARARALSDSSHVGKLVGAYVVPVIAATAAVMVGNTPSTFPATMAVKPVVPSMTTPSAVPVSVATVHTFGEVGTVVVMPAPPRGPPRGRP